MASWTCDGEPKNGKPYPNMGGAHEPHENFGPDCTVCGLPRESMQTTKLSPPAKPWLLPVGIIVALLLLLLGFLWSRRCSEGEVRRAGDCVVENPTPTPTPLVPSSVSAPLPSERISSGERALFRSEGNENLDRGTEAFALGNYQQAEELFARAAEGANNKPEPQIYLQNARARLEGNPLKIAAVVPVDNRETSAEEILRGLADAQQQFNDSRSGDRLLEIIIVNDGNDEKIAEQAGAELAGDRDILAVIGHNSSDATIRALPAYDAAGLPVISPTSTSTEINSEVFFRTVTSDLAAGRKLAEFAEPKYDRVAIAYDAQSTYSNSLLQAFKNVFPSQKIVEEIDLRQNNLDAADFVSRNADTGVEALLLLPNTDTASIAIELARANHALPVGKRMKLLGGDALYSPATLIEGGNAVRGLTLAVSWILQNYDPNSYAGNAETRWEGRISWRTATSYDAGVAIASVLKNNSSRPQIIEDLKALELSRAQTSGVKLKFDSSGDLNREPFLAIVDADAPKPEGAKLGFKWLPD